MGRLLKHSSGALVLLVLHVQKRQQLMRLDQSGILLNDLLQLHDGHVLMPLLAVLDRLIVLADALIDGVELILVILQKFHIMLRGVVLWAHIFAHDPFAQSQNDLPCLVVAQTEPIAGVDIFFIKLETSLQQADSPRKIPDGCLFQSPVV